MKTVFLGIWGRPASPVGAQSQLQGKFDTFRFSQCQCTPQGMTWGLSCVELQKDFLEGWEPTSRNGLTRLGQKRGNEIPILWLAYMLHHAALAVQKNWLLPTNY